MAFNSISYIRKHLGISTRQLALLLQVPLSKVSMASGGFRPLPKDVQLRIRYFEQLADEQRVKKEIGKITACAPSPQNIISIKRRLRLLQLNIEKRTLRVEAMEKRLNALMPLHTWLPQFLETDVCKGNEDSYLAANVLLRQCSQKIKQLQIRLFEQNAKLASDKAACTYWEEVINIHN